MMVISPVTDSEKQANCLERNPFTIPEDGEVFQLRQEQRLRRISGPGKKGSDLKELQKVANGSMPSQNRALRLSQLLKEIDDECKAHEAANQKANNNPKRVAARELHIETDHIQEKKETMREFIGKKRDMLLLQMSIDTKKEEINKLEGNAQSIEKALQKSEQMLEEDAIRFDTFLKENDRKAQDAIRESEKETKKKMDKTQELKRLNSQMQLVQADIDKHTDALEDCLKYKHFLDDLAPAEWSIDQKSAKKERQERRRKLRIRQRKEKWRSDHKGTVEDARTCLKEEENHTSGQHRRERREKRAKAKAELKKLMHETEPEFEEEALTSSDEESPMYFERPQLLLGLFSALEEENLFLIQNTQESEQALEELRRCFSDTCQTMNNKTEALKDNISSLQESICNEEAKTAELTQCIARCSPENRQQGEESLQAALSEKVRDVYLRCGFSDAGSNPSTLSMLSHLEARMEELLEAASKIPAGYLKKAEKDKEKKRREVKRAEKQAAQEKAQEERTRKAIERSLQPPKKRAGRPIMFRSHLPQQKVEEDKKEPTQDELDEIRFLN